MLLKDLVEDCPFEQMRVAGTGLLREVLAEKLGSVRPSPRNGVRGLMNNRRNRYSRRRCCWQSWGGRSSGSTPLICLRRERWSSMSFWTSIRGVR